MDDFVMTVRSRNADNSFGSDVATDATFLAVPRTATDFSATDSISKTVWYKNVVDAGKWKNKAGENRGDILFIVHGYNMSTAEVLQRHHLLRDDLEALNFNGVIVSFDWPTQNKALAYWEDRHDAKLTAFRLVDEGIEELSAQQTPDCPINVHILCHSTGAFVLREAFEDADGQRQLFWPVVDDCFGRW
jgi:esterase/lipase superfamily enzyme